MNTQEQRKKDAWAFVNCQVKAYKLMNKSFHNLENVRRIDQTTEVHMKNVADLCELLGISYERVHWKGNVICKSNYDEVFFVYKGLRFFELVDKEGSDDEGK